MELVCVRYSLWNVNWAPSRAAYVLERQIELARAVVENAQARNLFGGIRGVRFRIRYVHAGKDQKALADLAHNSVVHHDPCPINALRHGAHD
jgi:hypothetical protein